MDNLLIFYLVNSGFYHEQINMVFNSNIFNKLLH